MSDKTYTLYILENKINGKRYVGQTTKPLNERLSQHKSESVGSNMPITRAIQKYGLENFEVTSFTAPSLDALNKLEVALIDGLDCLASKGGYNIKLGGKNSPLTADEKAHLRDVWDVEKRQKISRKLKQKWVKKKGRCEVCGKDTNMGYDPDLDFRLCPSCRHAHRLSQDLGITDVREKL